MYVTSNGALSVTSLEIQFLIPWVEGTAIRRYCPSSRCPLLLPSSSLWIQGLQLQASPSPHFCSHSHIPSPHPYSLWCPQSFSLVLNFFVPHTLSLLLPCA